MSALGYVVYRGPSLLNGKPIVAIVLTGRRSRNAKTGNMRQTYILSDQAHPVYAIYHGLDASICGDCPHRGDGKGNGRSCYVTLKHGPSSVYRALKRRRYGRIASDDHAAIAELGAGHAVRLGTYGDPAAVPVAIWEALVSRAKVWTGYTHQWKTRPELQRYVMASVDTDGERYQAMAEGWRTFRVRTELQPVMPQEITCPASIEAGKRTNCADCGLCRGQASPSRKSIVILAHGVGARHFQGR